MSWRLIVRFDIISYFAAHIMRGISCALNALNAPSAELRTGNATVISFSM